jgi:hypothetical protein
MSVGIKDYIRAAFNARPAGQWVPPNWIGLGLFGVLGLANPGFWVLGAGLEFAYLYLLGTHPRFRRLVAAADLAATERQWEQKLSKQIRDLDAEDQRRYRALEGRCRSILGQQPASEAPLAVTAQADGLRRLLWIYLRLLLTRQSMVRALRDSIAGGQGQEGLDRRIKDLEARCNDAGLPEDLRKSLQGQIEILKLRQARQQQAKDKLAFLEAELTRIQEQAELIREQAVLTTDPETVSARIDQISQTLGGTTEWIQQQQQIYGSVEDLLDEPPPVSTDAAQRMAQKETA